jgi:hypothetical protein
VYESEESRQTDLIAFLKQFRQRQNVKLEPIDTSSNSEFGSRFDCDTVLVPEGWVHRFPSVALVGEMKTDLLVKTKLADGLGQLADRFSVLRQEQIHRTLFWGFVTDLTFIVFLKATLPESGNFVYERTPPLRLFSLDRGKLDTGSQILSELLFLPRESLGLILPRIRIRDKTLGEPQLIQEHRKKKVGVYATSRAPTSCCPQSPL